MPEILNNGKMLKCKKKIVMVWVFDKDTAAKGGSGRKVAKVRNTVNDFKVIN